MGFVKLKNIRSGQGQILFLCLDWAFRKKCFLTLASSMICGLYYKHVSIVNDDSSVVSKWSFKLIDDPRVVIYSCHRFIIQATEKVVVPVCLSCKEAAVPAGHKVLMVVDLYFTDCSWSTRVYRSATLAKPNPLILHERSERSERSEVKRYQKQA